MQNIFIELLPPWVETGLQPAFYDKESGTVLQQVSRMYAKINQLIGSVNNQNKTIADYIQKFIELKDYVYTYFNNLDVQDEINNKLDQMSAKGQLADIIAQYLHSQAVFGFDTIAEMSASENLINGSICKVLGKTNNQTGDGGFYKIRTVTTGDVIDGVNKVAITHDNTLIAELITDYTFNKLEEYIDDNYINVKYNGAKGDGETDDYTVLQSLINNNHNKTLFFPDGEYIISQPLNIETENSKNICFKLSPNAIIKTNSSIDYLIEIGLNEGIWNRYEQGNCTIIDGGIFDASNCLKGAIHHVANRKETQIMNAQIINAHKGIVCDLGTNTNSSSDLYISNLNIFGRSSYEDGSIGLELYSFDNKIYDVRIACFQTGVYDHSGNYYENVHVLMDEGNITYSDEQYNKTKCYVHAGDGGDSKLLDFYNDTCAIGFEQQDNNYTSLIHCFQYWWKSTTGMNLVLYRTSSGAQSQFIVTDCNVQCPPICNTIKGLELLDTNIGYRQYLGVYESIKFTNNVENEYLTNPNKIALEDWIYCTAINPNKDTVTVSGPWLNKMEANKYYPIAYVKEGAYSVIVRVSDFQIIRVGFVISSTDTRIVSVENLFNGSQANRLTIAICNRGTDSDGFADGYLCIKVTDGPELGFNVSIGDIKSWNQKLFVKKNYFQALTNPVVNDSKSFNQ